MAHKEPQRVLGTAGHIDHGKSSLIRALTGTDPDRLAEEKKRGITIELGFAKLELPDGSSMGVVDAPGHERFVRQMIAGSTGIDIALLCIAADDGVMPQTREHMAVLELLAIPTVVVALTKCDRTEDEWISFVTEDVRAWLQDTAYPDAPIVATSAATGAGLDDLREALARALKRAQAAHRKTAARMPIDRVFTIKGAGTVVTGTLWSGQVSAGDELQVLPAGITARARSIEEHDEPVEVALAGNRVAINLGGVKTSEMRPGDFLAAPGTVRATDRFDTWFTYLPLAGATKALETGVRVRLSHGTREVFGRVLLMDGKQTMNPRESALAQIRLEEPLPVSYQDHYIVRSESPVAVIGGGMVLAVHPRRRTTLSDGEKALLEALRKGDAATAIASALSLASGPVRASDLARATGAAPDTCARALARAVDEGGAIALSVGSDSGSADAWHVTKRALAANLDAIEQALVAFHRAEPDEPGVKKADLAQRSALALDESAFDALLACAAHDGRIVVEGGVISHPEAGAGAKALEQQAAEKIAARLKDAGTTPPAVEDLLGGLAVKDAVAWRALGALAEAGRAVRVGDQFAFDEHAYAALEQAAAEYLRAHGQATVSELKDALGVSRKYAVPLMEHFDATGLTKREGDLRSLA